MHYKDVSQSSELSIPGAFPDPTTRSPPPSRPQPHSTPNQPPRQSYANGFSTPRPHKSYPISPARGATNNHRAFKARAVSEPPTNKALDLRCTAVTQTTKQCSRKVNANLALMYLKPEVPMVILCWQHVDSTLQPTGFYSHAHSVDEWITFSGMPSRRAYCGHNADSN